MNAHQRRTRRRILRKLSWIKSLPPGRIFGRGIPINDLMEKEMNTPLEQIRHWQAEYARVAGYAMRLEDKLKIARDAILGVGMTAIDAGDFAAVPIEQYRLLIKALAAISPAEASKENPQSDPVS